MRSGAAGIPVHGREGEYDRRAAKLLQCDSAPRIIDLGEVRRELACRRNVRRRNVRRASGVRRRAKICHNDGLGSSDGSHVKTGRKIPNRWSSCQTTCRIDSRIRASRAQRFVSTLASFLIPARISSSRRLRSRAAVRLDVAERTSTPRTASRRHPLAWPPPRPPHPFAPGASHPTTCNPAASGASCIASSISARAASSKTCCRSAHNARTRRTWRM